MVDLLKEVKKYRDEMVARNYPFQAISDIITKYELENPPVAIKNDDRGPLDLTRLLEEKDREINLRRERGSDGHRHSHYSSFRSRGHDNLHSY